MMGHIHKEALKKTADYYGVKLKGNLEKWYNCSMAKIRQVNVCKETLVKGLVGFYGLWFYVFFGNTVT
jgi:hypothetical protein